MREHTQKLVLGKVVEIIDELRDLGMRENNAPDWVWQYNADIFHQPCKFIEWFEFVYLPNCIWQNQADKKMIIPQLREHMGGMLKNEHLLQLLVELDSIY